ncbi:MAG: NAD-dependent DNA ligase LigA [Candidatus Cryptobacteroides sp.]
MNGIQNRIEELSRLLREANRRYYVDSAPDMSDYEYDMLMKELQGLEEEYPQFRKEDSPTRRVGSDLAVQKGGKFRQYPHKFPMLSLGNTYNIKEIQEFADRAGKTIASPFTYSCELKFDGVAICLEYRDGVLYRALTRGDGSVGDDVTENVLRISNIPKRLSGSGWPAEFEIRGEIYMPYRAFDALNEEKLRDEEQPFANPRNAASGSLKLTNPDEVAARGLECTLYHLLGRDLHFRTHDEALRSAMKWGLPVSDKRRICRNILEIEEYIDFWNVERRKLPFATDGIVIKINELDIQKELGYTAKAPRWAVAYKFKAEQALSRVLSIDYQVGRTGAVTPVANLEPALLSGTVVKRASLHNADQMELLDIRVGDYVYVEKGGEIIPKITAVELSKRAPKLLKPEFPQTCPDCGTPLVRDEGEARWYCPNIDGCPTQIKASLTHFLSRKAMNVLAGDSTVEQLFNLGYVRNVADFYTLTADQLMTLEGWREKSAKRFLDSLEQSKSAPFEQLLFALGIRHVGESTAKGIARHFGSLYAVASAGREELLEVEDVGEIIADSVYEWFRDGFHLEICRRLKDAGLQTEIVKKDSRQSDSLRGKSIVISGTFSISRDEMKALIEANGGKNSGSISSKTAFLLAGEKPGPEKLRKAESLGVRVIDEAGFRAMLDSGVGPEMQLEPETKAENRPEEKKVPVQLTLF